MKIKNKKDPIFILLLLVVITIWGLIIKRVIDYFSASEDEKVEVAANINLDNSIFSTLNNKESKNKIDYQPLDRDPFTFKKIKPKVKKVAVQNFEEQPKETLNFKINGVLVNNNSKTLVITDNSTNETLFLKEGDSYKSIKIIKISSSEVKFSEFNKTNTLKVSY